MFTEKNINIGDDCDPNASTSPLDEHDGDIDLSGSLDESLSHLKYSKQHQKPIKAMLEEPIMGTQDEFAMAFSVVSGTTQRNSSFKTSDSHATVNYIDCTAQPVRERNHLLLCRSFFPFSSSMALLRSVEYLYVKTSLQSIVDHMHESY